MPISRILYFAVGLLAIARGLRRQGSDNHSSCHAIARMIVASLLLEYARGNSKGTDLHRGKDFAVSPCGSLRRFISHACAGEMPSAFARGVTARTSVRRAHSRLRARKPAESTGITRYLARMLRLPLVACAGQESSHSLCSDFPLSGRRYAFGRSSDCLARIYYIIFYEKSQSQREGYILVPGQISRTSKTPRCRLNGCAGLR